VPHSDKVRTRLQALDERLARLRMEKNRLIARVSQAERKRDTRCKILIGGAVLAAVEHEGVPAMRSRAELLRWLNARLTRPHDRTAFDLSPHEAAEAAFNRRPIVANRPAAERLSRMPTSGRHRAAARSVLESRVSGGHAHVRPNVDCGGRESLLIATVRNAIARSDRVNLSCLKPPQFMNRPDRIHNSRRQPQQRGESALAAAPTRRTHRFIRVTASFADPGHASPPTQPHTAA
jgi:hypothetical protein